jgi:hypothetical protein
MTIYLAKRIGIEIGLHHAKVAASGACRLASDGVGAYSMHAPT